MQKIKTVKGVKIAQEVNPISFKIGQNIRIYRKIHNISQKTLGGLLNITSQQVHKYENGTNDISYIKLHKIATILEVSIDKLVNHNFIK